MKDDKQLSATVYRESFTPQLRQSRLINTYQVAAAAGKLTTITAYNAP
jgi:hypothetical protein